MTSFDSGLAGVVAAETVLSHADGAAGILWVRGHTIGELVADHGYEGTVALLWEGFAGDGLTRDGVRAALGVGRQQAFSRLTGWLEAAESRPLIEAMRVALVNLPEDSTPAAVAATLPVAIAALLRRRGGAVPIPPDPALGTAADLLRMAGLAGGTDADQPRAEALDTYFTAVVDNGLSASGFAARLVASTGASLLSAAVGAYCAFTGPLHGGAPGPTLDLLDEAEASGDVAAWALRKLGAGERLMGFGHRVFRNGDPRADALRAALDRLGEHLGARTGRLALAAEVEQSVAAAYARLKPGRPPLKPNVEINAALLLDSVGLPRDSFMPVFAVARSAGWLAHAMEQQRTGRLIRPSSAYIGPRPNIAR